MKHKIQKVISILLVIILLLPSAVFAQEPRETTEASQETIFYAEKTCVLLTQTATEGIVKVVVNGDINELPSLNYHFTEKVNQIENRQPVLFSNTRARVEQDTYSQTTAYYTGNQLAFNAVVVSQENLTVNASVLQAEENDFAVLASQQGNITLSSANLTYQGILYAPNGTVFISASNLDFRGVIIAQSIIIEAPNAIFAYDNRAEEYLAKDSEEEPLPDNVEIYEKPLNPQDILVDEATGIQYVKGQILLTATEGITKVEVADMVKPYGGTIVGYISVTNDYQIVLDNKNTKAELDQVILELETNPLVESVLLHWVIENEYAGELSPNDPWIGKGRDGEIYEPNGWDEDNPDGSNWGLEATKVLSAWKDKDQMQPIKVGVIDSGVWAHTDLDPKLKLGMNEWNPPIVNSNDEVKVQNKAKSDRNHGTHVAGIIGAETDNGTGISGVAPNAELYTVTALDSQAFTIKRCLAELIVRDVKIINFSIGAGVRDIILREEGLQRRKQYFEKLLSRFLENFINEGYDFLIVQASGNDSNMLNESQEKEYGWADSRYTGYFNDLENEEVNKHIIVVGAYGTTGNNQYHIWERSQIGDRVDILAPGENIASLAENRDRWDTMLSGGSVSKWTVNQDVLMMSGTSMAAPHVSGVAAMVWGINPDLTAEQVKNIIMTSSGRMISPEPSGTTDYVKDSSALTRNYPLLNAKNAISKAKRTIGQGEEENPQDNGVLMGKIKFPEGVELTGADCPEIALSAVSVGGITEKNPTRFAFSDSNGEFSFVLPEGEYIINVVSTEFQMPNNQGEIKLYPFSMYATVKNGQVNYMEEVRLQRNDYNEDKVVTITGKILDGISEQTVSNVYITASKIKGVENSTIDILNTDRYVYAQLDGSFKMNLALGNYTIAIERTGFETVRFEIAVAPENNPAFKFVFGHNGEMGILRGTVKCPEEILNGQTVYAGMSIIPVKGGLNADNMYNSISVRLPEEFNIDLPEGEYMLNIWVNYNGYITYQQCIYFDIKKGQVSNLGEIQLIENIYGDKKVTINGNVLDAIADTAISNVKIMIATGRSGNGTYSADKIYTVYTNQNGDFQVELPTGYYKVSIQKSGYTTESYRIAVSIQDNPKYKFKFSPKGNGGVLKGKVIDAETGEAWSSQMIEIRSFENKSSASLDQTYCPFYSKIEHQIVTDENGEFEATVPPGRYLVYIQRPRTEKEHCVYDTVIIDVLDNQITDVGTRKLKRTLEEGDQRLAIHRFIDIYSHKPTAGVKATLMDRSGIPLRDENGQIIEMESDEYGIAYVYYPYDAVPYYELFSSAEGYTLSTSTGYGTSYLSSPYQFNFKNTGMWPLKNSIYEIELSSYFYNVPTDAESKSEKIEIAEYDDGDEICIEIPSENIRSYFANLKIHVDPKKKFKLSVTVPEELAFKLTSSNIVISRGGQYNYLRFPLFYSGIVKWDVFELYGDIFTFIDTIDVVPRENQ